MTGATPELKLATATDSDEPHSYLTRSLVVTLQKIDGLFSATEGHTHSGSGQGGPVSGAGGGGGTYTFTQLMPSAIWTIPHGLAGYPSVTVVDTGNSVILPDIHYDSPSTVTLTFGSPTSGRAYLN